MRVLPWNQWLLYKLMDDILCRISSKNYMYILYTHQKTHLIIDKVPESCFIHQQKIITEKRERDKVRWIQKSKEEKERGTLLLSDKLIKCKCFWVFILKSYSENLLMESIGTCVPISSSSIPILFLSKYFNNAPTLLT